MELMDQINKLGKGVYAKTKDAGEIVKLNAMITEQNSRIDKLYQSLGREVYQDEDFREVIVKVYPDLSASIAACLGRIQEYQARIKEIRGVERCPACGAENTPEAVFCSGCGSRLAEAEKVQEPRNTCPACGAEITFDDAQFCTTCGAKLTIAAETESEG